MVNHKVTTFWNQELSVPGHNLLLARSSGDDYKSVTLHCTGSADPYLVEEGEVEAECGWSGPNIRPGRWHEKHIAEAFALHVAQVAEFGPIVHGTSDLVGGVKGNFPAVCRCFYCRNQVKPQEAA